jgi:hypothetical protein
MRHWFKFLLPYLNANISNTTTIDTNGKNNLTSLYFLGRKNHHHRHQKPHNSTLNSTQKFFTNFLKLNSPLLRKLLNVSLSNQTESGNNVRLPNVTNETRVFLFRRPVLNTFIFKILDFSNEQNIGNTNNRTNVSSLEINSDTNKVKFLHQQNSRLQNYTINSNFNNNNNNGQVEIVFKLKSILKDIFKF